jgi:hypothetical protein
MTTLLKAIVTYYRNPQHRQAVGHVARPNYREAASKVRAQHSTGTALLEAYDRGEAKIGNGKLTRISAH